MPATHWLITVSQVSVPLQNSPSSQSALTAQVAQSGTAVRNGMYSTFWPATSQPGLPGPAAQPHQFCVPSSWKGG